MDRELKRKLVNTLIGAHRLGGRFPKEHALSPGEHVALMVLDQNRKRGNESMSVTAIREELRITMPGVSQIIKSLEKKGYVLRAVSQADRRRVDITLTSEGEALLLASEEKMRAKIEYLLDRLGERDALEMVRIFERVNAIVDELHASPCFYGHPGDNDDKKDRKDHI